MAEEKKNLGGRPASSKTLMNRIKRLQDDVKTAREANLDKVEELADLDMEAFSVVHDPEKKEFNLITVSFDLETGLAKVKSVTRIADSYQRMIFEMKKLLATNVFLQKADK